MNLDELDEWSRRFEIDREAYDSCVRAAFHSFKRNGRNNIEKAFESAEQALNVINERFDFKIVVDVEEAVAVAIAVSIITREKSAEWLVDMGRTNLAGQRVRDMARILKEFGPIATRRKSSKRRRGR